MSPLSFLAPGFSLAFGIAEEFQDLSDCWRGDCSGHWEGCLDQVSVAPPILLFDEVSSFREVGHDPESGPLCDLQFSREIPQSGVGIAGYQEERPSMVGQQTPLLHGCCR